MTVETIRSHLVKLRLNTAAKELEEVLAKESKNVALEWFESLLCRELDARKENATTRRIREAQFPELTCLEDFNWDFNPKIDKSRIMRLATLDFVQSKSIVLFLGKPGAGKTHIALALGVKAAQRGHRVFCTSVKRLGQQIMRAKAHGQLDRLFSKILSASLWIFDDWGVVSMSREVAEEVFDLLDRRKYGSALILTSNRDVGEWGQVFSDPVLASAAIDRLFDRADIHSFAGESYRLKGRIKDNSVDEKK